ncbi:MAG: MarR family transcriptional regulator [Rhodospirillales bacterium]|nr:MarR family transcriptional regulator [Rhodospirillales bacterium]QQS13638.1 MAG: MarR family transcriptional regulator [Rhodospirillales bacterium]
MDAEMLDARARAVRRFNRFYTQRIGVLKEGLNDSPFPLAEARVLYELAHRDDTTATGLARDLGLDAGYLSRILGGFEQRGLLTRRPAADDARRSLLTLTRAGRKAFAPLDKASQREFTAVLGALAEGDQRTLLDAMATIERLLGGGPAREPFVLRPHRIGDMGWVVASHATLYHREFGWNHEFEALVAEIAAKLILSFDPAREASWIAEKDGRQIGSAFVVRDSDEVARLRLVLVEPEARGTGLGRRLVREAERFARAAGYRKMTLWTNNVLLAARAIYASEGYALVAEEPYHKFGCDLVGETWDKPL